VTLLLQAFFQFKWLLAAILCESVFFKNFCCWVEASAVAGTAAVLVATSAHERRDVVAVRRLAR
jgi:hypothetical protein